MSAMNKFAAIGAITVSSMLALTSCVSEVSTDAAQNSAPNPFFATPLPVGGDEDTPRRIIEGHCEQSEDGDNILVTCDHVKPHEDAEDLPRFAVPESAEMTSDEDRAYILIEPENLTSR